MHASASAAITTPAAARAHNDAITPLAAPPSASGITETAVAGGEAITSHAGVGGASKAPPSCTLAAAVESARASASAAITTPAAARSANDAIAPPAASTPLIVRRRSSCRVDPVRAANRVNASENDSSTPLNTPDSMSSSPALSPASRALAVLAHPRRTGPASPSQRAEPPRSDLCQHECPPRKLEGDAAITTPPCS